ncbi:OmpA family protein [Candidatus Fukatsuia symbiotica]|uniref:OmpA family protein n=1 Tax=Candidatus Fukatsuia symbiotica TaxID=1878942 RepID=A0A2U8I8T9_9GAMM|nr:OmpA family protein [Candidatus Fukatsuia symbiotica]AWK14384.1 OmpA family protein [Candidatus Fukatsuia symbiotica]MEA9444652.1 OmpA family protein [Candidatus Fukatsuia symbiotica]
MPKGIFRAALAPLQALDASNIAEQLGEKTESINKGFSQATASVVKALSSRLKHSPDLEDNITDLAANVKQLGAATPSAQELLDPKNSRVLEGKNLLSLLFPESLEKLYTTLAQTTGLKIANVAPLMNLAAGSVLETLEVQRRETNSSLASIVAQQDNGYLSNLPDRIAKNFFSGNPASVDPPLSQYSEQKRSGSIWWWLLPLCILAAAIYWYSTRPAPVLDHSVSSALPDDEEIHKIATPTKHESQSTPDPSLSKGVIRQMLPGGRVLTLPENSTEARLLNFIKDPAEQPDKEVWFDFDNLVFSNSTDTALKAQGQTQLDNISAILVAYPNVKLKIGGDADNTGDAEKNREFSQAQAQEVMNALIAKGVSAERLSAEGYGENHPVASHDTAEGRNQNRRVSVRITAK